METATTTMANGTTTAMDNDAGDTAATKQMIILASDNWTGAHPAISMALLQHSAGGAKAYGASDIDRKIEQRFAEIFERSVAVYFVGTGSQKKTTKNAIQ